jgi:hypothetical protein
MHVSSTGMHAYALLLFVVYLVHGFILGIAVLVLCGVYTVRVKSSCMAWPVHGDA